MVRETLKYKIDNIDSFFENFKKYVDVTVSKRQVLWNFFEIKKDYFGKIEYKKFSVYHLKKRFAYRRIILEINGEIDNGELLVKVKDYSFFGQLFTFIALNNFKCFYNIKIKFLLRLSRFCN